MATLDYKVLDGETFFDIAAKLYADTPLGISDLMALNNLNLNDPLPSSLVFTPGLKRSIKKINVIQQPDPAKPYLTREGQSHYDVVIQLYGSYDQIGNVLSKLPSLDAQIPTGTMLDYPEVETQASLLFRKVLVSTLEQGGYILQENAFKIILEDDSGKIKAE